MLPPHTSATPKSHLKQSVPYKEALTNKRVYKALQKPKQF